jgi:FkbM family methyltransferase
MLHHRSGADLLYRRELGDIETIQEVWVHQIYCPPRPITARVIVDLGAHIGMATLWLAATFRPELIIAVEPNLDNVRLARRNFAYNEIPVVLLEGAIGASHGVGMFAKNTQSNVGRVGSSGSPVRLFTMMDILQFVPDGTDIDILKVDVEGSEEELFAQPEAWLPRVRTIIAEFHPPVVDDQALVRSLQRQGFDHVRGLPTAGSTNPGHFFFRRT